MAPNASVVLMSRRPSAPYDDAISDDGTVLTYEGHDARRDHTSDPKSIDQPWKYPTGGPTDNAKFAGAVDGAHGDWPKVRVYEKLRDGIWTDKGLFELIGYHYEEKTTEERYVFRFIMRLTDEDSAALPRLPGEHSRMIPSWVKQEVFKRDKGSCVICGSKDQIHYDHELPFSRGGASILPENIRILCARHNLSKGARIE